MVGHVEDASPQLDLLRLGCDVSERVQGIERLLVDFRKVSIRRAGIRSLQLEWIEQAFDCPQAAVSESLGARCATLVIASAVPMGPMLGREKPIFMAHLEAKMAAI